MVYYYEVLIIYIHAYDSLYYFLCYMYVLVYLQCSYTFVLHIRLFLEFIASILLISFVA
jgi:hypothetical protein